MDVKEFDEFYDSEIKRCEKSLPDPNTFPYWEIRFPILFTALTSITAMSNPVTDRTRFHEIIFEKYRDEKSWPKYKWRRK